MIQNQTPMPELNADSPLNLVEPKYSDLIPPMQLRRMSKCLKMGLVAALDCFNQSKIEIEKLSTIAVGTAYGLHVDSAVFLTNMIKYNETALTPTAFIQSTHNTISGAIALSLQSNVHNMTFVNKGWSFENSITDTELILDTIDETSYALVGAVDEKIAVLNRFFNGKVRGLDFGEAASFFVLGNRAENAICKLNSLQTFETKSAEVAAVHINKVMANYDCSKGECPTIIWNSNNAHATILSPNILNVSKIVGYNPTGSGLAMAIGVKALQHYNRPTVIINQFEKYWSIITLSIV